MYRLRLSIVSVLFVLAAAAPARADWLITPYIGSAFGGDTVDQHVTYGASAAWMSHGVIGLEADASIAPDLLDQNGDLDLRVSDSNVTTLMGNIIIGAPIGAPGVRPYVVGGAGLIRSRVSDAADVFDIDDNSFGFDVGGGIIGFFNEHVGVRGDVRYFRALRDVEPGGGINIDVGTFDFWRATGGVTFRF